MGFIDFTFFTEFGGKNSTNVGRNLSVWNLDLTVFDM